MPDYRDRAFLRDQIRSIIDFYHPACMDRRHGGFINQFLDDGSIFDARTKHLVGTCRFTYNFALCSLLFGEEAFRESASHGLNFLADHHRQSDGGYAWVLDETRVADPTRHCYGHAFVLLAAAGAAKAGIPTAAETVAETYHLLEVHFWEPEANLYVDEIAAGDWSAVSPYRGQNCNMHMCEAMIAAYEATGEERYIARAATLARRICLDLATDGLIWEHYRTDWTPDWEFNRDNPKDLFKPYGYLPGHFVEWAKLLVILERYRPEPWHLPTAERLFRVAMEKAFDPVTGGIDYAFAPDGTILDTDRYYWVSAEAIAAAALLALRTGNPEYWDWYDRHWLYADRHFVDHRYGGWFRVLDAAGNKYSNEKSPAAKTDYHPLAACYEVLEAVKVEEQGGPGRGLANSIGSASD
jgi:mannose/cellobiose epimerase-like protein (N-acyl-D-glucosamine 2-epimerase family)